jgi:creatinine amidohydrolase/Fe(II)-dependent formamide hydrolase-like protein
MISHHWRMTLGSLLFVAAGVACAVTPATVFLEDLTSPELKAEIATGKTTVIIPVGGTEQSGPHIALGKHNVRVRMLSGKIASALGNAIVAPVLAYVPEGAVNPPTGHMRYPGTITLPADTYRKVIEAAARSFRLHGFRDIVVLGDHGDYQKDNLAVAQLLNREWAATPVRVHAIPEYYRVPTTWFANALQQRGFTREEIGMHAGLADTALTLALEPRLVRQDLLKSPAARSAGEGVSGMPQRATADLGQIAVDAIVSQTVAAIRQATARH